MARPRCEPMGRASGVVSRVRRPFRLQATSHLLRVVLIATVSALGFASLASAAIGSVSLVDAPGGSHAYDASARVYDGALHSADAHASAAALVASLGGSEGVQGTVATASGPISVLFRISVAANSAEASLYRGVGANHPGYADALAGTAKPRGGVASASEHNMGSTLSPYTSWTTDLNVAQGFAGEGGVVLRIPQAPRPGNSFVWSPDRFFESEVLIEGTVTGAGVLP